MRGYYPVYEESEREFQAYEREQARRARQELKEIEKRERVENEWQEMLFAERSSK